MDINLDIDFVHIRSIHLSLNLKPFILEMFIRYIGFVSAQIVARLRFFAISLKGQRDVRLEPT